MDTGADFRLGTTAVGGALSANGWSKPRLIAAADFGSLDAVKALIMNSADLEAQDKSRRQRERPRGEFDADSGMRQSTGL